VKSSIFRLVHHAHTTAAEFLDDAVVRVVLSDERSGVSHWRRVLVSGASRVNETPLHAWHSPFLRIGIGISGFASGTFVPVLGRVLQKQKPAKRMLREPMKSLRFDSRYSSST
jgi:hypothetical protein